MGLTPPVLFYKEHLEKVILPFWTKNALDLENGGVYTCFSMDGATLISRDKYTWSQGRFLWLASRLVRIARAGELDVDMDLFLEVAEKTASFLFSHVFLDNGHCAFVLSNQGVPKLVGNQERLDASMYADCFVCLGFTEYASVTGDLELLNRAWDLYLSVLDRAETGDIVTEPYTVPSELTVHGIPMILLNLSYELYRVFKEKGDPRTETAMSHSQTHINSLWLQYDVEAKVLREHTVKPPFPKEGWEGTLLCEHIAPGHTAETLWMMMEFARDLSDWDLIDRCLAALKQTFRLAWDDQFGGLFRFVGLRGGAPNGRMMGTSYEDQVLDTWDMKLWWVHTEFLYAAYLGWSLTQDQECRAMAEQIHQYTFTTFPNPNETLGEWLQKRDRQGLPQDKIVALPVKDPYHIARDLLLLMSLSRDDSNIEPHAMRGN